MKDNLMWAAGHLARWVVLYGAFCAHIPGVMHLQTFLVWATLVASVFLLSDEQVWRAAARPPQRWRTTLEWVYRLATLGLLVWGGYIVTGLAWVAIMGIVAHHQDTTAKARAAAATLHAAATRH